MTAVPKSQNLRVREALPSDAEQLIRLVQRISAEQQVSIGFHPGEFQVSLEDEVKFIRRYAEAENCLMLVAEEGGKIIGVLTLYGSSALAARHSAELGVMVDQQWRGKGAGSLLIEHALAWARQNPILKRVELRVFVRNADAVRLYERFGFEIEGRRRMAIFREGQYHDDYIMGLILEKPERQVERKD